MTVLPLLNLDYDFEDFEPGSEKSEGEEFDKVQKEGFAKQGNSTQQEVKNASYDSKNNPHLLISEHGNVDSDIKNKVINVAEIEGIDDEEEEKEPPQIENFSSIEGHHQAEEHSIPNKTNSRLGLVSLTPVDKKDQDNFQNYTKNFGSIDNEGEKSRDQELLSMMEDTMKKEGFDHDFDFELQNEEVGGVNLSPKEEEKHPQMILAEGSIEHDFHMAKPSTEKDEIITQDKLAKTLYDHSGQKVDKEIHLNLKNYSRVITKEHKIDTNPVKTTKNQFQKEVIEISQTPTSMILDSNTIVDSEQKRMLITQNYR